MSISISTLATVSKNNAIRENEDGSISVNFYAKQSYSKSDTENAFYNCRATFKGAIVSTIREYFTPGLTILLRGDQMQKLAEVNGKYYINNYINNPSFEFLPRSSESGSERDTSTDFNPEDYESAPPETELSGVMSSSKPILGPPARRVARPAV